MSCQHYSNNELCIFKKCYWTNLLEWSIISSLYNTEKLEAVSLDYKEITRSLTFLLFSMKHYYNPSVYFSLKNSSLPSKHQLWCYYFLPPSSDCSLKYNNIKYTYIVNDKYILKSYWNSFQHFSYLYIEKYFSC